jgi:hypothetical protein
MPDEHPRLTPVPSGRAADEGPVQVEEKGSALVLQITRIRGQLEDQPGAEARDHVGRQPEGLAGCDRFAHLLVQFEANVRPAERFGGRPFATSQSGRRSQGSTEPDLRHDNLVTPWTSARQIAQRRTGRK